MRTQSPREPVALVRRTVVLGQPALHTSPDGDNRGDHGDDQGQLHVPRHRWLLLLLGLAVYLAGILCLPPVLPA